MFVIDVIPIIKNLGTETLSYFTTKAVPIGAVVEIPLRKKLVQGLVVRSKEASEIKGEIKKANFALKKLEKVKSTQFFSKEFVGMAEESADYFATTTGAVLNSLVPDYLLKLLPKLKTKTFEKKAPTKSVREKYAVQGDVEERYGTWKSLIRQEFARKRSILFIFPSIEESKHAFSLLEKGIEGYAFLLNGSLTKKEMMEAWNKAMKETHSIALITTGAFLSFPREDIETIVLEGESSKTYKLPKRPFLDIRHCTEVLAEKRGLRFYVADNFLRLETLFRKQEGEIVEASPFKFRSLSTASDVLVDMRTYKDQNRTSFKILSTEVEDLIRRNKEQSENLIILATRRGLAPSTVCGDCQNIVTCHNCSAPVVLHRVKNDKGGEEKSFFLCHRCGERRSTEEYCKVCGSWKLGVVGIGIDLVEEKIRDRFPEVSIFKIDADTTKSDKEIRAEIEKFRSKPGNLLLGTEMMLQYLHEKIENSAIVSLDSLFALPDFRIQEKILHLLISMRSLTTRNFIVQTRKVEEKVFEYGLKGNTSDFYRNSIEERKQFSYPPFTILIKLTLEGKKEEIVREMEQAQTILEPYEVEVFPAFTHTIRGNFVLHGLIRLPRERWVELNLVEKLRSLSPAISIKVDPETLL